MTKNKSTNLWTFLGKGLLLLSINQTSLYGKEDLKKDEQPDRMKQNPSFLSESSDSSEKEQLSSEEKKKIQIRYQGQFLGHFGEVYRIKDGKAVRLGSDETLKYTQNGVKIVEVEAKVFSAFQVTEPLPQKNGSKRSLSTFEHSYLSSENSTDVFWVGECKNNLTCERRKFPDWETYEDHRKKNGLKKPILNITEEEFELLKAGSDMPSSLVPEFEHLLAQVVDQTAVKEVPLKDLCKEIKSSYVTYAGNVFLIERKQDGTCQRRLINSQGKKDLPKGMLELTSSQAYGIPTAEPLFDRWR